MAEAIAALGLLASILQLVDFSAKLVDRVNDVAINTRDVPETFRNISIQLPLAIAALQRLSGRIEGNELTHSEEKALQALVD
ncbi:uncharacterized protein A1O9_01991 [Exophiala aquamarina CBS 119918]|uniref:NACHT-NTPase and P-loop NTPases N-terminal domain-containing protein n=1 Tax=Exophiala aquamarina CBS 119918 TaxID=1182545 RepID=A0A072PXV6_9EURO|nr:uncharacterized protein A1O9_01991 [Exophiala aquamarina CBS 119918]KEF60430.1 hypothetical protein A1O9_01991 [Exophiala aquamarina CBS 119918]